MGVDAQTIAVLTGSACRSVDFTDTLTIGRQTLYAPPSKLPLAAGGKADSATSSKADSAVGGAGGYADGLFRALGASRLDSMDASPYEGATIIHDLNKPLAEPAHRYSVVFDGGSLEHIFDVRTAFATVLRHVAPGGHFIGGYPANNQVGHGFYQFSPELLFRILSPQNGFEIRDVVVGTRFLSTTWYRVLDPQSLGRRAEVRNRRRTDVYVIAQRTADIEPFTDPITHSDYASAWSATAPAGNEHRTLRRRVRELAPAGAFTVYAAFAARRNARPASSGWQRIAAP